MRSNIEGAEIRRCMFGEGMRTILNSQTLGGTLTLSVNSPSWLFLDPGGAGRTVLLPAEGSCKGMAFKIFNVADAAEDLTVQEDAGLVTIGVVSPGQNADFYCDGTTWHAFGGGGAGVVAVPDAATYTVLPGNSGRIHVLPNLTADITISLPAAAEGLDYTFWYGGAAADAQDWIITTGLTANFFIGGVVFMDQDGDVMAPVYADGDSNFILTVLVPEVGTEVRMICDGVNWYLNGRVFGATVPTLTDS